MFTRRAVVIGRRVLGTLPLMMGAALVVFVVMRMIPGDPVDIIIGQAGAATREDVERIRQEFHLDRPLLEQVVLFLGDLARGDLGTSFVKRRPVTRILVEALPATVELAVAALLVAVLVGLPVGILAATGRARVLDRVIMAGTFLGVSMPPFWLGLMLILLLAVRVDWLPTSGRIGLGAGLRPVTGFYVVDSVVTGNWVALGDSIRHLILPAFTLGAGLMAVIARVTRASMVEVLREQYILVARSKGLGERVVVLRHALRNALIPTVTVVGLQTGVLLGGNMIVETVFGWPGLGRIVVDAIFSRDYPLIQGAVMLYTLIFIVVNLAVDVLCAYLNPRIQA